MEPKKLLTVCVVLLIPKLVLATDLDRQLIPADSGWVVHFDMDRFRTSEIGKYFIDQLKNETEVKVVLDETLASLNLDPYKDLHGATLCGVDDKEENVLVYLTLSVDTKTVLKALESKVKFKQEKYRTHNLVLADEFAGAIVREGLFVFSQRKERVKIALDVIDKKAKSVVQNNTMPSLANIPKQTILSAVCENLSKLAEDLSTEVLKNSRMAAFLAGETNHNLNLSVLLTTESEETATLVEQLVRGVFALVSLKQQEVPELPKLLAAVSISRAAKTVKGVFNYPSKEIIKILKQVPRDATKSPIKVEIE